MGKYAATMAEWVCIPMQTTKNPKKIEEEIVLLAKLPFCRERQIQPNYNN
jgi:hypothetical protein